MAKDDPRVDKLEKQVAELLGRVRHLEAYRANLIRENHRLKEHNGVLQDKVRDLTARLNQDSSNSSKPPSSDKPWKERRKQKPTGRKPGGQPGHKGKARRPFAPEDVNRSVELHPDRCGVCDSALRGDDSIDHPVRHQIVDFPPVGAEVIEYVLHRVRCRRCGEVTAANLPDGVPAGCAGVRFQAIMTLLTGRCRLSRREARDIAVALFGPKARVSLGTVTAMERRTSRALRGAYDEALDAIQSADFVHCDETSWHESNKLAWLWGAVTPKLKVFRIDARRNREAFRKLLFTFEGILVTDRFSVYRAHDTERRQLCWAHVLRNLRGLEEVGGKARSLGKAGQKIVKAVFREWYRFREGEITRLGLRRKLVPLRRRLKHLLRRHANNPVRPARALAKDLREYGSALWTFAKVEGLEPTNNAAERAIRKAVLWRKGSFGSASPAGSRFVERMLTVCESLRAQGRSILEFLEATIRDGRVGHQPPSLLVPTQPAVPMSE